jgi:hypothetical protein
MSQSKSSIMQSLSICLAAFVLGTGLTSASAIAHTGHPSLDHLAPSRPDFQRIGNVEIEFHPRADAYTYKRPNEPALWFHGDPAPALYGAHYELPASEQPVVCATSGHRIRILYSTAANPYTPTAEKATAIRSFVRRMNSKIVTESMNSSAGARALKMRVDCDASGEINIYAFPSSTGNKSTLFSLADQYFGAPSGSGAVKNLIFYDGADPEGYAGWGQYKDGSTKNYFPEGPPFANGNRYLTASAVVYNTPTRPPWGYWNSHATLHELFHTMGAVQDDAPYSTYHFHCWTGIDVMCYDDDAKGENNVEYSELFCPANGYYDSPTGAPLDCNYDTYFDAGEESGEWLNTHWNVGGIENPFLVTPAFTLRDSNTAGPPEYSFDLTDQMIPGDVPVSGDWNGDGFDTVGFFRPGSYTWYLRNTNATGPANLVFQFGDSGDRPVVGDWNEDGTDTIGVYRPSTGVFFLRNFNSAGGPQYQFAYGNSEDLPIAGDWNNSGTDTIGLYRPSTGVFYLSNTNAQVPPDYSFAYGNSYDDLPVAGDWDENGFFSVGVYRRSTGEWFLDNEVPGNQPISYAYKFGAPGATTYPIVGDWNNSGTDTPGAMRK